MVFKKTPQHHWSICKIQYFYLRCLCKQRNAVSVFDLEKEYDTTWQYGIMKDLHNIVLKSFTDMYQNFLGNGNSNIHVGSTISSNFEVEMGVPQRIFY